MQVGESSSEAFLLFLLVVLTIVRLDTLNAFNARAVSVEQVPDSADDMEQWLAAPGLQEILVHAGVVQTADLLQHLDVIWVLVATAQCRCFINV